MATIDELLQSARDHRQAGRLAEAQALYEEALRLEPESAAMLNNLGTTLLLRGELAEARTVLERAVRLRPDYALAHNNLGSVWLKLGRFAEARACFTQALANQPCFTQAHYNRATAHHREGRLGEAETDLRQALLLNPDYAPAHYQLGVVLKDALRLDAAGACLEQALRLEPGFVDALCALASVLALAGNTSAARVAMDRALAIRPGGGALAVRSALILPVIYESQEELERERTRLDQTLARLATEALAIDDPAESVGATPFYLAYQGKNDRDLLARLAALYRRASPELDYVAPHCHSVFGRPEVSRPIRVGFLSTFFYRHTIGKLNLGMIRNLSREHFAVTLLRFPGPDDDLARALMQSADRVVTLPRNLDRARRQIAGLELDVLAYADIGMDPLTYFLAFARLAPVQCALWGHPVTTGIPTIDYFLSSTFLEPDDAAAHYTEELVRFDRINTYYYEPKIEGPLMDRATLGLDPGANLYVCTQSLFKVHPEFDSVLGQILRGDPRGRIVLIEGPSARWRPLLAARFRRCFPAEADRVVFLPRLAPDGFLQLQAHADLLLDTPHFGGGSTSFEAFAFGTPIVTGSGRFLRDRITSACYRQMGLADCIAETAEDYVRIALELGTDPALRDQVRAGILARKHRLFEDIEAVRQLEQFFRRAALRKG